MQKVNRVQRVQKLNRLHRVHSLQEVPKAGYTRYKEYTTHRGYRVYHSHMYSIAVFYCLLILVSSINILQKNHREKREGGKKHKWRGGGGADDTIRSNEWCPLQILIRLSGNDTHTHTERETRVHRSLTKRPFALFFLSSRMNRVLDRKGSLRSPFTSPCDSSPKIYSNNNKNFTTVDDDLISTRVYFLCSREFF